MKVEKQGVRRIFHLRAPSKKIGVQGVRRIVYDDGPSASMADKGRGARSAEDRPKTTVDKYMNARSAADCPSVSKIVKLKIIYL
jgi:hypothetical protein